jgi:lysophospholipase L1-like esterase
MSQGIGRLAIVVAVAAVAAAVLTTTWQQRSNTLQHGGRWTNGKIELALGVNGAVSVLVTRNALRFDRLHPGEWHGFHEILYRDPLQPRELAASFALRGGTYLTFLTRRDESGFEGVRISRHPRFPSACLRGDREGRFLANAPLEHASLDAGTHRILLRAEGKALRVRLDGIPIGRCAGFTTGPIEGLGTSRFGVRGAYDDRSWVDDIVVRGRDGERVEEDFTNREGLAETAIACSALVALLVSGAGFGAGRMRTADAPRPLVAALVAAGVALVVALLAWSADTFYLSKLHPTSLDLSDFRNTIEDETQVVDRLRLAATTPKGPDTARVLVLGSSQTWGAGVWRRDDTWTARLGRALDITAPAGTRVELFTLAISGYVASQLAPLLEREGPAWEPDAVLVNLSNNDRDYDDLAEALGRIAAWCAANRVGLVFVPEPNTIENVEDEWKLRERHEVMRGVAREHGVAVVEVHDWLAGRADTGFLWWDRVHLTDYGQALLAERLFEARSILLPQIFGAVSASVLIPSEASSRRVPRTLSVLRTRPEVHQRHGVNPRASYAASAQT